MTEIKIWNNYFDSFLYWIFLKCSMILISKKLVVRFRSRSFHQLIISKKLSYFFFFLPAKCLKRNSRQMEKNHEQPYQNLYRWRTLYSKFDPFIMCDWQFMSWSRTKIPFSCQVFKSPKSFEHESTVTSNYWSGTRLDDH